jgi:glutathione peroxidase
MASGIYDIPVQTIGGESSTLAPYRDQVLLIVNVASKCGYTPQYAGLEALYRRHHAQGFSVLGFPCNQFMSQEPGPETAIAQFCKDSYAISFPLFAKIAVNGSATHPLYRLLKGEKRGLFGTAAIKWNFTKFLVGHSGEVLARYATRRTPESLEPDITRALAAAR